MFTANPAQGFRSSIRESSVVDNDGLLYSNTELKRASGIRSYQIFVSNISEAVLVLSKKSLI